MTTNPPTSPHWYVYIVKCADNTLYTGITTDIDRRLHEHNHDNKLGARYTRHRRPVDIIYHEQLSTRSCAAVREHAIKKLTRAQKLALASTAAK